jgi:hypothetical protein
LKFLEKFQTFSKKIGFLDALRNPIFPKNRISWARIS